MVMAMPFDGWPPEDDLRIRRVVTTAQRRRAKRAQMFLRVPWSQLAEEMRAVGTDRATRLLAVLHLQNALDEPRDGWVKLRPSLLKAVGLADDNFNRAVARLERGGLVKVEKRAGKRPLLRLTSPKI
jgi:hypothetical protein